MKLDWEKLNYFRSMSREKMEGLLQEVWEKRDPAVPAARHTVETAVQDTKGV